MAEARSSVRDSLPKLVELGFEPLDHHGLLVDELAQLVVPGLDVLQRFADPPHARTAERAWRLATPARW